MSYIGRRNEVTDKTIVKTIKHSAVNKHNIS